MPFPPPYGARRVIATGANFGPKQYSPTWCSMPSASATSSASPTQDRRTNCPHGLLVRSGLDHAYGPHGPVFVLAIKNFAETEGIDEVSILKHHSKDEDDHRRLKTVLYLCENVIHIWVVQERFRSFRTSKQINRLKGYSYSCMSQIFAKQRGI